VWALCAWSAAGAVTSRAEKRKGPNAREALVIRDMQFLRGKE
jgi:hypothetical protein